MRHCLLLASLLGLAPLGCGKTPEPPPAKGVLDDLSIINRFAKSDDDPGPFHGRPRTDVGTGPEVRLGALTLTAPTSWKRTKPGSSYYLAEFIVPRADKDQSDARLTISVGAGAIETNLDVFEGEFDATGDNAKHEKRDIAGLQVTVADISGSYTGQHGQSAAATSQPGYRMIVAVIPVGSQLYFVKAVGPQQTIAAHVEGINSFLGSIQKAPADVALADAGPKLDTAVRLQPLTLTAPKTWTPTKPRSSFVQYEFGLPHVDKDTADGRLTVSVVGGTVKDNIERWHGQFVGTIEKPKQEEMDIEGLKATLIDFTGTFGEQAGMTGPVVNRSDYRMIGIIIPIGDQLYVIKAVGPKRTISANIDAINSFVSSLKRDN